MVSTDWDKLLAVKLINAGLTLEHAGMVVGIVAEERQTADRAGFIRGFNAGYETASFKLGPKKPNAAEASSDS